MKKIIILLCVLLGSFPMAFSQQNCVIQDEKPIQLLSSELEPWLKEYRKENPPMYYLSYTYTEKDLIYLQVRDGGIVRDVFDQKNFLETDVRVGEPKMDNTRLLKLHWTPYDIQTRGVPRPQGDGYAFMTHLWTLTKEAFENAQKNFARVQTEAKTTSNRQDDSPDFIFPKKELYCRTGEFASFDINKIKEMLLAASKKTLDKPFVLFSDFTFSIEKGHRYFVDSVGTRIKTPFSFVRMSYQVEGRSAEGLRFIRFNSYDVVRPEELPTEQELFADVDKSLQELESLSQAQEEAPISAPTILKNEAAGVFVHEVLGHRLEGHRQKEDSFGRTFTDKIGQEVTAPFISIVDDPTLAYFNGKPLRGFYEYDDEGVKSQPVTLVEKGVLKSFLMNSSPIEGFPVSNGHGRRAEGFRTVARMGNTRMIAHETVSYEELEKRLIEQINKQKKPYGFIVEDLTGGFTNTDTFGAQSFKLTPTLVYRVYPDGKKEVISGVDIVGTPLISFGKILAAANDDGIFNGSCGAESGWVPVSSIAPSVLLETVEFEKTGKSPLKVPRLLPPFATQKGGSK